jgi:hypothetical protein
MRDSRCLRQLPGMDIVAGGRFSRMVFAATEPRNREQSGEDKDEYAAHDDGAPDEAAGTCSHGIFFCHLTGPFSDLSPNTERSIRKDRLGS